VNSATYTARVFANLQPSDKSDQFGRNNKIVEREKSYRLVYQHLKLEPYKTEIYGVSGRRFVLGQYLMADQTINRAETAVPSGGCDLCEPIGTRPYRLLLPSGC
jgi:hypothetical protein